MEIVEYVGFKGSDIYLYSLNTHIIVNQFVMLETIDNILDHEGYSEKALINLPHHHNFYLRASHLTHLQDLIKKLKTN